jgi:uncharacterized protein (TIGR00725 family)
VNNSDKFKIGVFGSAGGDFEQLKPLAREIGQTIATEGHILITGGCPGLPYEAALGAHKRGGLVVGISPALNLEQHRDVFKFPIHPHILIFTGFEKKGRNVISIRTCDAAIFISGRSGTLNEFTSFWDEGDPTKAIGLLANTGGVVDHEIASYIVRTRDEKPSRVSLSKSSDPRTLIHMVLGQLKVNQITTRRNQRL